MSRPSFASMAPAVALLALAASTVTSHAQDVVQIPANTAIVVRTVDAIDSRKSDLAQEFQAALDEDLVVNGATLAPRGAEAVLRIVEATDAGAVRGRASLTLKLVKVGLNGRLVDVDGGEVTTESGSQGQRAVKRGAAGAVIGGILGGILGGGSGAATGAAIGGGAGVGSAVIQGEHVEVAPETRLTFTLASAAAVTDTPAAAPAAGASAVTPSQAAAPRTVAAQTFRQIRFTLLEAVAQGNTLTVRLRALNQGVDARLAFNRMGPSDVSIVDDFGNTYQTNQVTIGNQTRTSEIINDVPTTITLSFDGLNTIGGTMQASEIKRLVLQADVTIGSSLERGRLEFRDIPIQKP